MYKLSILLLICIVHSRLFYHKPDPFPKVVDKGLGALPTGTTCKANTGKALFDELPETQTVYSGYLKVKEGSTSVLAYIFYGSQKAKTKQEIGNYPTIIWLNGGPGSSSQMGNFMELGPMYFQDKDHKILNKFSWDTEYNIMFVDQPVGAGFAYYESENDIPRDQDTLGQHFVHALLQFLTADEGCVKKEGLDKLLQSPWFIFGESYAGKYVPTFSEAILKQNKEAQATKINLKGAAIGDPFTDPYSVIAEYATYSYNFGLIDYQERSKVEQVLLWGLTKHNQGDMISARDAFGESLDFIITQSGDMNVYNVLEYGSYDEQESQLRDNYLNTVTFKDLLGFSEEVSFSVGNDVIFEALKEDFMKRDCVERVENVLKEIPFMVYNGQNDLICSTPGTLRWVYNLNHAGSDQYKQGDLNVWKVNDKVVGYYKEAGNLRLQLINNAGHLVPKDQPEASLDLVKTFVEKHK